MPRILFRLTPILAIFVLLALAGPAAAQQANPPGAIGEPPSSGLPELCVPVGLALAVISPDGVVADILPQLRPTLQPGATPRDNAATTFILTGPGAVGACPTFQGFWGPGASGIEASEVVVYRVQPTAADPVGALQEVARDGLKEQRTGPATFTRGLRALTKIEQPGTYHFVAVLSVTAARLAATSATAPAVTDSVRVPFTVELRLPEPPGTIEGTVYDNQGNPLGGVAVMVMPAVRGGIFAQSSGADVTITAAGTGTTEAGSVVAREPLVPSGANSASGAVSAWGAPAQVREGAVTVRAVTDALGDYRIAVPAGQYVVGTQARGFAAQFYRGKATYAEADRIDVQSGAATTGIDFALSPAPVEPPPAPVEYGLITGKVIKADGTTPVKGATVMAIAMASSITPPGSPIAPLPPQTRGFTATTGEDGTYVLKVAPGSWRVQSRADGYEVQWFDHVAEYAAAATVAVAAGATVASVDFALKDALPNPPPPSPEPNPVPPAGGISGVVTTVDAGGAATPVGGAPIIVARRVDSNDPALPPTMTLVARGVTGRDGKYLVQVEPGSYVVGLLLAATNLGSLNVIWWDGQSELKDASLVTVTLGVTAEGVNFVRPGR
jgi:hypothetical protein